MLNVKKVLTKITDRCVRRDEVTFTVPALSAGAKGYWTIPLTITPMGFIVAIQWWTSNIAASGGLQLTPVYIGGGNLYVAYYAPTAIPANTINGTFFITTFGGGYSLKVFSVLSRLVRGWEYVERKENAHEIGRTICVGNIQLRKLQHTSRSKRNTCAISNNINIKNRIHSQNGFRDGDGTQLSIFHCAGNNWDKCDFEYIQSNGKRSILSISGRNQTHSSLRKDVTLGRGCSYA